MTPIFKLVAHFFYFIYGYEGINVLLRVTPSKVTVELLRNFGATIGKNVRIQAPFIIHNADQLKPIYQNLEIGDNCYIGRDCIIDLMDKVTIGSNVTISHRAIFNTHTDVGNSPISKTALKPSKGAIVIKEGVYLGTSVTILENVVIGKNSIIGSSSLVNNSIPDKVKAFGVPCKVKEN